MSGIRRALLFTSAERYTNLTLNFLLIAVVSRLLTPSEIGVSAFGVALIGLVELVRDIPSSYLVQQKDVDRADIRTAFTVMLGITLVIIAAILLTADWIAELYQDPKLATYLRVLAIALLTGPFERPLAALIRREMSFGRLAVLNVAGALVNAVTTVGLALAGFGYMSFAWATVALNLTVTVLTISLRPDFGIFRPQLTHWRRALHFGGTTAVSSLLAQCTELLPYLVLSRVFQFDAVGYYNRALQVSQAPNKLLLSGLSPVILPAFAAEARAGRDIKHAFLLGISHISAVYWPAFLLLAFLAHPAVAILVGSQWFSIVPLVQVVALAMLFSFANILLYPVLMSAGALRHILYWSLIAMPVSAVIAGAAAMFGLMPLALSLLITVPLQNFVGLLFVQLHAGFTWGEFLHATRKSVIVAMCANLAPAVQIAASGFSFEMSIGRGIMLGFAAIFGWLAGIWLTKHPMLSEMMLAVAALRRRLRKDEPPAPPAQ